MKEIIKISIPNARFRQKVKQVNANKYSWRVVMPAEAGKYRSQVLLISEDFCKPDPDKESNTVLYFYADQQIRLSRAHKTSEGEQIYENVTVDPKELYECFYGKYEERFKKFSDEEIDFLKNNVSVLDFLTEHAGLSFQRQGQHYYRCDQHQSLVLDMKKNIIHWNSMNCHGNAITYLEQIENKSFPEAMNLLVKYHDGLPETRKLYQAPVFEQIEFKLPEASNNQKKIFDYLCTERKIDMNLVRSLVDDGKIYLDEKGNCVFKCENYKGKVDGAFRRSTYSGFRGDVAGGNKFTGFYIEMNPLAKKLVLTEAFIDGLSYITAKQKEGKPIDFNVLACDSCSVVNETFRVNYLTRPGINQNIDTVILATDNDKAGRTAAEEFKDFVKPFHRIKQVNEDLPALDSDWNKDLQNLYEKDNLIQSDKKIPLAK